MAPDKSAASGKQKSEPKAKQKAEKKTDESSAKQPEEKKEKTAKPKTVKKPQGKSEPQAEAQSDEAAAPKTVKKPKENNEKQSVTKREAPAKPKADRKTQQKDEAKVEEGGEQESKPKADKKTQQKDDAQVEEGGEQGSKPKPAKKTSEKSVAAEEGKSAQQNAQKDEQQGKTASVEQDQENTGQNAEGEVEQQNENKDQNGEDLTTVLDEPQRHELVGLTAKITHSMRTLILDNFNAAAGLDESLVQQDGLTDEQKMMSADVKADIDKLDKQKKTKAKYEKDLNTTKTKNLKKAILKAYDEWRKEVMQRISEAVKVQGPNLDQIMKADLSARPQAPNTTGKVTDESKKSTNLRFKDLYPPTKTTLTKLSLDRRTLVIHSVLLILLSLEHYNATSRVLLLNLTSSLKLSLKTFEQDEYVTGKGLLEHAKELTANEETKKKAEENQDVRLKQVRYAQIAGAALLGLAGSFAAPLIASGIGSVATGLGLGTTAAAGYLGSVASSSILVGSLFGAYGGRMTGQMMDKYAREVEDFEFMPVHSNARTSEDPEKGAEEASAHDHKLRVTICLSGWLTEKEDVIKPWRVLGSNAEVFALKYELESLMNLGNSMDGMVQSAAWGYAQRELIQQTVFADLMAAMWPVGLMKVARVLDNPFSVAKARAEKVGEVLADALINRVQGERPVTLIGYSLGARAIYVCLQSLAKRRAFNLIENAVLIGAPTPSDTSDWRAIRSAVSGRLVNVYSKNDYILGFMYRTSSIQYGVAGLQAIEGLPGVENVDVSEEVDGHLRYRFLTGGILKKIGFEDVDMQAVEEEQAALKKMVEEEKKNSLQAQRNKLMRRESHKKDGKVDEDAEAEAEASEMERQVKTKTEKTLVTRAIEWWYTPRMPNQADAERVAKNLQRAANNPADVRAAAGDTVQDARESTAQMAQRVYAALPNIPYMSSSSVTGGVAKADPKNVEKSAESQTQSYTALAAAYMPQSMPSIPAMPSMPSMPSIPGYSNKKKEDPASKSAQATKDAGEVAKKGTSAVTDTVGTTVKNTANINDNPVTKQLKEAPGINKVVEKDPGVTQTLGKVTGTIGTTVGNATDMVTGGADSGIDKAGAGGSKAVDAVDSGAKKVGEAGKGVVPGAKEQSEDKSKNADGSSRQSYTSYAASYIPSMPTWRTPKKEQQQKPEEPEQEDSSDKSGPGKPKGKESSNAGPSKSPAPKLGSRKASETGSGAASATKSPAENEQNLPNIAEQVPGAEQAQQAASAPQQTAQKGTDALSSATSQVPGGEAASGAVSQGQAAAKKGTDAVSNAASKVPGGEAATGVAAQGQAAARKGTDAAQGVAEGVASQGTQAAKKGAGVAGGVASQGQQAASAGASAATGAVGGAFSGGKKMFGFGRSK